MTPKQERFRDEYLIDFNGKQAAIRAGYSPATAEQQASRLLRNVQVKAEIAAAQAKLSEKTEINFETITEMLRDTYNDNTGDSGNQSARVSALTALMKLHGLETDVRKNERDPLSINVHGFDDTSGKVVKLNGKGRAA